MSFGFWPHTSGQVDLILDGSSTFFYPMTNFSAKELVMEWRSWTVSYHDTGTTGVLSFYIDTVEICTTEIAPIFPGGNVFSSEGIPFLAFGPSTLLKFDDEGLAILEIISDIDGIFGQFDSMQLWDRALEASEVAHAVSNRVTGNESGLCIYWCTDRGFGSRIPNLGSAGAAYDGVLGQYAVGVEQTSDLFGTGCDAVSATPPAWLKNKTEVSNTPPIADNQTQQVRSSHTPLFSAI